MKESFNGEILEIPGIAVDNFSKKGIRAYFLSHCHSDHTVNLKILSIISENVFIYMSEISAAIVECHIEENLRKFIKPLKLETTTITIPGDENAEIPESFVEVTLIPAGHCFGSVMFLFETPLKTVLYTGDFRLSENSVSKMAQLHRNNKPIKIDTLYVDTTFQDKKYDYFPKRSEVLNGLVQETQSWLNKGVLYRVGLMPSARYGYEDIFNKLYKTIGIKVYVGDINNWRLYSKFLDRLPGVTNNFDEKRIHLCSKDKKYCKTCTHDINYNNNKFKYLYFNLSAMRWTNISPEDLTVVQGQKTVNVCYATHCCRSELIFFIEYLSPKTVIGFPNSYTPVEKAPDVTLSKRKSPRSMEKNKVVPRKVSRRVLMKLFDMD